MNENIHNTSIIDSNAVIDNSVIIGPYCIIGPNVKIKKNTILKSNVIINGHTEIGTDCTIYPFTVLGNPPQDLKFKGEVSKLIIGNNNVIREHVTMNPGTEGGGYLTKIGNNCLIMVGAHVAHDCLLGNNIILANNASLAGHVQVDDFAILGGLSGVHQFVRIGSHAMVGGLSALESDVIPYGSVIGNRAYLSGLNIIGLKRRGFNRQVIHDLRKAYRLLFAPEGTIQERIKDVSDEFQNNEPVMDIVKFIEGSASRAICQPKNGNKNT
jgi:UDP-N-acetylglucosamine acyltransferase